MSFTLVPNKNNYRSTLLKLSKSLNIWMAVNLNNFRFMFHQLHKQTSKVCEEQSQKLVSNIPDHDQTLLHLIVWKFRRQFHFTFWSSENWWYWFWCSRLRNRDRLFLKVLIVLWMFEAYFIRGRFRRHFKVRWISCDPLVLRFCCNHWSFSDYDGKRFWIMETLWFIPSVLNQNMVMVHYS